VGLIANLYKNYPTSCTTITVRVPRVNKVRVVVVVLVAHLLRVEEETLRSIKDFSTFHKHTIPEVQGKSI
jgi:hypothetical protein